MDSGTLISSTLRSSPTVGGSCGRGNECDVRLAILSRNIFVKVVRSLKASLEDSSTTHSSLVKNVSKLTFWHYRPHPLARMCVTGL